MKKPTFSFIRETITKKPSVCKGREIERISRAIVYGIDLDFYTSYDEVFAACKYFLDKELQLPALAYEQKLKEPYGCLEIVRNGVTFGDMPVWEMRFVTKVMYEVEIAEELCEEQ